MMQNLKRPKYQKPEPEDFFKKMYREVHDTVLTNDKYYRQNVIKSVGLLLLYFGFYSCILFFGNNTNLLFLFYILTGFTMIVLFINAFHDAVHGAVFKSKKYNVWFTHILEVFGSNTWLWSKRHIGLHHPYPSIQYWDIDIKQSDVVRIFPQSPLFNYHKYQHLYMWFLYPLYSLNWLYIRDFKDFFGSKDNYVKRVTTIPHIEYFKLFAAKIFNILYLIVLPSIVLQQPWYIVLTAWICMHVCGSMLGVIALISTHADEDAEFPMPDDNGRMTVTWAMHQLQVTKDFSADSTLANFLYGGFTHHVAHHLFPDVAHTYYPHITPIIKKYANEYGLPYTCYPFYKAVRSHFRLLKNSGKPENILFTGEI
ncbi:fatty acid desaturase family protein [Flavobacterium rhizosphaerae]|uniref:Fatty acid desaturase n=1 Tax=Flavobacterium rhizosphaerae TaxID=3163298 RepID=A0ABW8YUQ0_9FLAO